MYFTFWWLPKLKEMNIYTLPDLSQDSPKKWENLSHNNCYLIRYHNSPSSAKCPRCGDIGSLIEDGRVRALYECRSCGIFSKIKPKPKRFHRLTRSIARRELTTALEILEIAGHKDQDAIDALNLYRGDDSNTHQKTTASNDRRGFVLL